MPIITYPLEFCGTFLCGSRIFHCILVHRCSEGVAYRWCILMHKAVWLCILTFQGPFRNFFGAYRCIIVHSNITKFCNFSAKVRRGAYWCIAVHFWGAYWCMPIAFGCIAYATACLITLEAFAMHNRNYTGHTYFLQPFSPWFWTLRDIEVNLGAFWRISEHSGTY